MINQVNEYISDFEQANTSREVWLVFLKHTQNMGFEWSSYIYQSLRAPISRPRNIDDQNYYGAEYNGLTLLTTIPKSAEDAYFQKRIDRNDPRQLAMGQSLKPMILGQDFLDKNDPHFNSKQNFIAEGKRHGIHHIYCIPLKYTATHRSGSVTFFSRHSKSKFLELLDSNASNLHLISFYLHVYYQALVRHDHARELGIKGRLLEVLNGIVAGKSNKEIADELDVSEPTVSFHMTKVKRRLRASNSREIVTTAARLGLLEK